MRPYTTAACFATYALPHVLFVVDIEERSRIARACCLAWNIALFPTADERERLIRQIVDRFAADAPGPVPSGFFEGYAGELQMLAEIKRDLFPWQLDTIARVDLEGGPRTDTLVVDNGRSVERIDLVLIPAPTALPRVTKVLAGMAADTATQRRTLEKARRTPGLVEAVVTAEMVTVYCAQRADLRGYHRMLTVWREASGDLATETVTGRFLPLIEGIEADTKAVLAVLVGALDAAATRPSSARH